MELEQLQNNEPQHIKTHVALPQNGTRNPYIHAATSDNTCRAYQNDIKHFVAWGGLLPTTPEAVIAYLQAYASTLNSRTLVRRLTAIKHWHTYQGFSDPTTHLSVRKTLTGIMHVHGIPKQKAPAILF